MSYLICRLTPPTCSCCLLHSAPPSRATPCTELSVHPGNQTNPTGEDFTCMNHVRPENWRAAASAGVSRSWEPGGRSHLLVKKKGLKRREQEHAHTDRCTQVETGGNRWIPAAAASLRWTRCSRNRHTPTGTTCGPGSGDPAPVPGERREGEGGGGGGGGGC